MITRIVVIDPAPRDPRDDVVVYQVPERSRAYELLITLLNSADIEWVEVAGKPRSKNHAKTDDNGEGAGG